MAKSIGIQIGGETHKVRELSARKTTDWIKMLDGPVQAVVAEIAHVSKSADELKLNNADALKSLVSRVGPALAHCIEDVLDLLIGYAPYLQEQIDENMTVTEAVDALVEVVQLAIPFQQIVSRIQSIRMRGLTAPPTSPN